MADIKIVKRNGEPEDLDLEKIQKYEQPITPPKQPKKEVKKKSLVYLQVIKKR